MKLSDIKANPWIQPHVPEMYEGPVGEGAYPAAGTFIEHTEDGYIKMGIAYEVSPGYVEPGAAKPGSMPAHWGLRRHIEYRTNRIREWVALRIAPWLGE
jgi:hypothetical protein